MNSNFNGGSLLSAFADLFFPPVCSVCGMSLLKHETEICRICLRKLPRTRFEESPRDNSVSELFWGRCRVEKSFSLFSYRKGENIQKLMYDVKYRGNKKLGCEFGRQLGMAIKKADEVDYDILIPIPLHHVKLHKRGFNQAEVIAKGIGEVLDLPVKSEMIFRNTYTSTQTRKGRFERWENVKDIFCINSYEAFKDKHIMLVDDVITTGSTLEACINILNNISGTRVSIATVAYAAM